MTQGKMYRAQRVDKHPTNAPIANGQAEAVYSGAELLAG